MLSNHLKSNRGRPSADHPGEGRAFSAGGDIKKMVDPESPMDIGKVMGRCVTSGKSIIRTAANNNCFDPWSGSWTWFQYGARLRCHHCGRE